MASSSNGRILDYNNMTKNWRTKPRRKRSKIYQIPLDKFKDICNTSNTLADILRGLNMHVGAGNYKTIHKRIIVSQL